MPLIKGKSPKAFKENVETEMHAGKPQKQSLAIAFATQRHARKKKMAYGGKAEDTNEPAVPAAKSMKSGPDADEFMAKKFAYGGMAEDDGEPGVPKRKSDDERRPKEAYMGKDWAGSPELDDESDTSMRPPEDEYMANHFAKGGAVHPKDLMDDDERAQSIADAIMDKRHGQKMMAEGGEVDLQDNGDEDANGYYARNEASGKKELYDDSQLSSQPEDSNEKGHEIDSDAHDMISKIRQKMKMKKGME